MDLESRIAALEGSLARQRKISTVLLCLLFAGLGMGATSVASKMEIANTGLSGTPIKVVLVDGKSSKSAAYKAD
jgi:membrane protein involved in colicin uptake